MRTTLNLPYQPLAPAPDAPDSVFADLFRLDSPDRWTRYSSGVHTGPLVKVPGFGIQRGQLAVQP
jgi:hypothetical protein